MHGLNPSAVLVMQETGVDITNQQSIAVDELSEVELDVVVTVCGHVDENCPMFQGAPRVVHVGFDDSPKLAREAATEEDSRQHFRRVRDEMGKFVGGSPGSLPD